MLKRLKNIAHPFLAFIIAAFSLVFECDVWLFTPPKQWWFISVLMLAQALAIGCYWSPVWCSVALLLLNGVGEYAIPGYAQFTSYFMFLSVILICYKTSNRIAAALCLLMMSYTCLETMIRPGSFTGYGCLAFCMVYAVASTVGRYMAWEQRRTERMRESVMVESRLRQLEANQYLAAHLHDALSQELALISMETQLHAVDKSVPDEERWRRVSDYTQNALADLRGIITQLRDDGDFKKDGDEPENVVALLRREAAAGDKLLHDHGFSGETVLDSAQDANMHSSELGGLLSLICHEIYTNMLKHAETARPYHVSISLSSSRVCIRYANGIGEQSVAGGGSGLRSLQSLITSMGGDFSHDARDGEWNGTVAIPGRYGREV